MIPKIIHYTWFSNEPMAGEIQECIDSWKRYMPDYTLMKWDLDNIADINNLFMREAITKRKWAFAADVVRLFALYRHGGIYLDTDIKVFKSFDSLLNLRAFIGRESSFHLVGGHTEHFLTSQCFGAEPRHPFIKRCIDYYEGRRFVTGTCPDLPVTLRLDMTRMSYIQSEIARQWGYNPSGSDEMQHLPDGLEVFPSRFFDPMRPVEDSYCRHLALGSWCESRSVATRDGWKYSMERRLVAMMRAILRKMGYEVIEKN